MRHILPVVVVCIMAINSIHGHMVTRPLHLMYKPSIITPTFSDDKGDVETIVWGSAYGREMDTAYDKAGDERPLSHHLFDQQPFTLQEVFPISKSEVRNNPFTAISHIDPKITYCERGAWFGFQHKKHLNDIPWKFGVYAKIPVVHIEVEHTAASERGTTSLSDVAITRDEGNIANSFAYRFDFLNTLTLEPTNIPLVSCDTTPIRIAQIDVTETNQPCNVPVTGIYSEDGTVPKTQFAASEQTANQAAAITPSSPFSEGTRGRFAPGTLYQPLCESREESRKWFITPTICDDGDMHPDARIIQTQINNSIDTIETSIDPFLISQNVSLSRQETTDIGDIDLHLAFEYENAECSLFGVYPGLRIPSGERKHPGNVLQQPTGNNGHVEALLDMQYMQYITPESFIRLYGQFGHSFRMDEERLANPASVRNIGVPVRADISWEHGTIYGEYGMHLHKYVLFNVGYTGYFRGDESVTDVAILDPRVTAVTQIGRPSAHSHSIHLATYIPLSCITIHAQYVPMISGESIPRETKTWSVGATFDFA